MEGGPKTEPKTPIEEEDCEESLGPKRSIVKEEEEEDEVATLFLLYSISLVVCFFSLLLLLWWCQKLPQIYKKDFATTKPTSNRKVNEK